MTWIALMMRGTTDLIPARKSRLIQQKESGRLPGVVLLESSYVFADRARNALDVFLVIESSDVFPDWARNALDAYRMDDGDSFIQGLEREIVESVSMAVKIPGMEETYGLHNICRANSPIFCSTSGSVIFSR